MLDDMTFAAAEDLGFDAMGFEGNEPVERNVPMYMQVRNQVPRKLQLSTSVCLFSRICSFSEKFHNRMVMRGRTPPVGDDRPRR